jgi:hypothetical protein
MSDVQATGGGEEPKWIRSCESSCERGYGRVGIGGGRVGGERDVTALIYLHATSDGHQSIAERINRRLSDDETVGDDDDGDDDGSSGVLVPP